MKAIWNGTTIAQSDETVVVEGNHYFPPQSVSWDFLEESNYHTTCPWKGIASYYTLQVNGKSNQDAAWCYPQPSAAAGDIKDYIAFWKGVAVVQ